jgi:hypothetical protein
MCHSTPDLQEVFRAAGFSGLIIGATPIGMGRDAEIQSYLFEHPGVTSYVILDDMKEMGDLTSRLVCTYPTGLEPAHVKLALEKLF